MPYCVVVGILWGCKVGTVVWVVPPSELLLEEVCISKEAVSTPLELMLHVIIVAMG